MLKALFLVIAAQSMDTRISVMGIESVEHASAVLRRMRSSSSSQKAYQTMDTSVFSVDSFNRTVAESASTLCLQKMGVNQRFGGDGSYTESEIIRTKFSTAPADGGDMSGFEYDSFGDRSPQRPSKNERSLDNLRVSAEFKKMLTTQVYRGEGDAPGKEEERDEFGILEDDDHDDNDDPYATGKLEALMQDQSFDFDSDQGSPSRSKYEMEKTSPARSMMSSTTGGGGSSKGSSKLSKPAMAIAASRTADGRVMMNKDAVVKKTGVFVRPSRNRIQKGKTVESPAK